MSLTNFSQLCFPYRNTDASITWRFFSVPSHPPALYLHHHLPDPSLLTVILTFPVESTA